MLFVTVDGIAAGVLLLDDSLKPEAAATVAGLKELGVRPIPLTGDRPPAAARREGRRHRRRRHARRPPPGGEAAHILAYVAARAGRHPGHAGLGDGGVVAADAGIGRARGGDAAEAEPRPSPPASSATG